MTSWEDFAAAEPDLAERVEAIFNRHKHKTMATLRQDGSPRISGTEVEIKDGRMRMGSMPGAMKAKDLLRDPRVALHSASTEPKDDDPTAWKPDAKVAGRAIEVTDPAQLEEVAKNAPPGPFHLFEVDVDEVVITGLGDPPDHLVIDIWTAKAGRRQVKRT